MPRYRYRAAGPDGQILRGNMQAADESALYNSLRHAGYNLLSAQPTLAHLKLGAMRLPLQWLSRQRLDDVTVVTFCQHLQFLVAAGTPFLQALADIRDHAASPALKQCLLALTRDLENGIGLAQAFANQSALPPLFSAIMAAAERTGDLRQAATQLLAQAEWQKTLHEKISRALRYPIFLLVLLLAVMGFMLTQVVPQVRGFVMDQGQALPWFTQALLSTSDFLSAAWPYLLCLTGFLFLASKSLMRISPLYAHAVDGLLLRLPIAGSLIHDEAMLHSLRHLHMMLCAGEPLLDALRHTARHQGNIAIRARLTRVIDAVGAGIPFSQALREEHLLSPMPLQVLHGGERSGHLPQALEHIVSGLGQTVQNRLQRLIAGLEPAMTLGVGLLMIWIVAATLLPVYGTLSSMGRL